MEYFIVATWPSGLNAQHWHGWHRQCGEFEPHTLEFSLYVMHFESMLTLQQC